MEKPKKPVTPYKSMKSRVEDECLVLDLEAIDVEETIRFAYSLHLSLLPVVHKIYIWHNGQWSSYFSVAVPNHGK